MFVTEYDFANLNLNFFRDTILKLLLDGARELGNIVCSHIRALLNELHTLRRRPETASATAGTSQSAQAGTSSDDADNDAVDRSKGFLMVSGGYFQDLAVLIGKF